LYLQCHPEAAELGTVPLNSCFVMTSVPVVDKTTFYAPYPGQLLASDGIKNSLKNLLLTSAEAPPEAQ